MTLTLSDIKTLESLFIVEMHAAERIFRLVENGMADIYRESKDYKAIRCPRSEPSRKAVRSGESGGTSRPHQLAERFGHCELVADATLKVISTLKVLAKDHSVSPAILEELKTN